MLILQVLLTAISLSLCGGKENAKNMEITDLDQEDLHPPQDLSTFAPGEGLTSCSKPHPLIPSDKLCAKICINQTGNISSCSPETGACFCPTEPVPTNGYFMHCTNWKYVEQEKCTSICSSHSSRVCWTFMVGNYCVCYPDANATRRTTTAATSG